MIFRLIMSIYNALLLFSLLILTFLTTFIHSEMFRREAVLSLRAVAITIFPLPILYTVFTLTLIRGEFTIDQIQPTLWMRITLTLIFPVLIMMVLFIPNVSLDPELCYSSEQWIKYRPTRILLHYSGYVVMSSPRYV